MSTVKLESLVLLSLQTAPDDPTFKTLRRVASVSVKDVKNATKQLAQKGLVGMPPTLTDAGKSELKNQAGSIAVEPGITLEKAIRRYVMSELLGISLQPSEAKALEDLQTAVALLSCKLLTGSVPKCDVVGQSATALGARHIMEDFLFKHVEGYRRGPTDNSPVREPIVIRLLQAATGSSAATVAQMLYDSLRSHINLPESKAASSRWKGLMKAGIASMAAENSVRKSAKRALAEASVVAAVDRAAIATPSGWVTIYSAYESYQATHDATLDDFKSALARAAANDAVELAALDVPTLHTQDARLKSALNVGGMTYYRVRLPR